MGYDGGRAGLPLVGDHILVFWDGDDAWYAGTVKRDFDHGLFTVVYDDGERRAEDLAEMSWRLGPRASAEASARVACCARGWKIEAEATAASADAEGRPEYGEGCARAAPVAGAAVAAGAEDEAVAADVGDEAAADDPPYEAAVGDETATGDEAADDGAAAAEGGRVAAADVRPAVARDERATGALGTRTVTQPAKAGTAKSIGKRRSTHEEREERRARKRERRERRELEREARATPRDVAAGEDDLRNGEVDEYVGIPSGSSRHMDLCQTALEAAAVAGDGTGDEVLPPDPAQAAGRPRRSTGNPRRSNGPSLAAGAPIARPPGPQPPHSSTKVTSKLLTAVEMAVRDVMAEVILPAVRREVRAAFEKHTRSQVVPARVDAEKPPPVQLPCPQAANELNIISYMQRMLSRHNKNNPNSEDVALLFDDEDLRAHTRNVFEAVGRVIVKRLPELAKTLTWSTAETTYPEVTEAIVSECAGLAAMRVLVQSEDLWAIRAACCQKAKSMRSSNRRKRHPARKSSLTDEAEFAETEH